MIRYFEAPHYWQPTDDDPPAVFLAGGISGVERWHPRAVDMLDEASVPMVVLNPARRNFPVDVCADTSGHEQVSWEQHHLHLPGVLTAFWFPACDPAVTTQPIAMFELGQALGEGRRLVVGADPGYARVRDVHLMMLLNRPDAVVHGSLEGVLAAVVEEVKSCG